jgi:hypothetical protein
MEVKACVGIWWWQSWQYIGPLSAGARGTVDNRMVYENLQPLSSAGSVNDVMNHPSD